MMKYSKQRELIYQWVAQNPVHPTADTVYEAVRMQAPRISLGTVYRNLNLLSETGALIKIPVSGGSDRFDGRTDQHFHMACTHCGHVLDVELPELVEIERLVAQRSGFQITGFQMLFEGICSECLNKDKEAC
ncbi:MAG: transcriptional repressor [Angelakisella sp.]|nr:transcriptional repressor [Angelakisella sp.]